MTGFELRLWRKGMGWTQERAAEELGVNLRTYVNWERRGASKLVQLATTQLTIKSLWGDAERLLLQMGVMARHS